MQLRPQPENYFGSSKPEAGFYLLRRYLWALFISTAGMLTYTPWIWRPDERSGDSKQGTESSLHLPSLRVRFILAAWMASSMRSIQNRGRNDGDSKRTRE